MTELELASQRQCAPRGHSYKPLITAASVSFLGGFLFGYDNIVISGAIGFMAKAFSLDAAGIGWAAGCALVGCLIGSAIAGLLADRWGLKITLMLCAACFAASSLGILFCGSMTVFVLWRIIGGLGIGAASILAPMYIAEIAPSSVRGRLVTLYQLGIVLGILSAVFVNLLIQKSGDDAWNQAVGWKWMFFSGLFPSMLFALLILPARESPRWLLKKGRVSQGRAVLAAIHGELAAEEEFQVISGSLEGQNHQESAWRNAGLRRALLLGIMLAGLSQASGITPVFSYLPSIFEAAGSRTSDAFVQSLLVSLINMVFTLVALWLVDKLGRRTLLLLGTAAQALALTTVGILYWLGGFPVGILAGVMVFVAAHALGNGAVAWVIISEIFPTQVRGKAMSIATTFLWIFAFLGNLVFPLLKNACGNHGTFWIFGLMALLNALYVLAKVPETKGYSLEQIQERFQ